MNSPSNTNPAILGNMLDSMDGGGGKSELIKVSVNIVIDGGDTEAYWYQEEDKRFTDIIAEIEKGNLVLVV